MSIHALEKMKDAQSVPALQQVANSTQPDMVKQAAAKAIEAIGKVSPFRLPRVELHLHAGGFLGVVVDHPGPLLLCA